MIVKVGGFRDSQGHICEWGVRDIYVSGESETYM